MPAVCKHRVNDLPRKIKKGKVPEDWSEHKAAQKDTDARNTLKHTKKKPGADLDLVIPSHGYKTHVGIDNRYGFIRTQTVTSAAAYDGHFLEDLIDPKNLCGHGLSYSDQ